MALVLPRLAGQGLAGRITSLEYQKRNQDRVSVFVDGRFAFGLPAIVAATLRPDQFLSDADVERLREQGSVEDAYNSALDYLSYRPRSREEVVRHLQRRNTPEPQIEAVAARLQEACLLDDEAFARFWVENRERFRPRGLAALRYELRSKGVADDAIEQATEMLDPVDSAYRAADKKARQLAHLDQATFHRKLVEFLVRRGFEYEVARQAAQRHWEELTDQSSSC
jgi:regulatory protein